MDSIVSFSRHDLGMIGMVFDGHWYYVLCTACESYLFAPPQS